MRQELDQALCEKYPLIFKERHGDPLYTSMCQGFGFGDGWYTLIDVLCSLLQQDFTAAAKRYAEKRSDEGTARREGAEVVTAVDVERARLAMSAAADALPVAVQVKQKFGTLHFYLREPATPEQRAYIGFAQAMSTRTCEVCGAPGEVRRNRWIQTLCQRHQDERQTTRVLRPLSGSGLRP